MRTPLFYDNVKIEGPRKKILEINQGENGNFLDKRDLKNLDNLFNALEKKENYHKTKIDENMCTLLTKLI